MGPSESATRSAAWFFASVFAILPSGAVAVLTSNHQDGASQLAFDAAMAWGAGAFFCVGILRVWHSITHRFESLTTSTMAVIAAIFGAVAGLIGAAFASPTTFAVIFFISAFLGSLQGAAIARFVVGPDLHAPPEMRSAPEDEDNTPNPPTPTP